MRILVTGHAGFIGSHVADMLTTMGHFVHGLDNLSTGRLENISDEYSTAIVDITDRTEVAGEVRAFKPHVIIHLAAQASGTLSVNNPEHDARVNIMGTLNLLREARQMEVKRFVSASSFCVYGSDICSYGIETMPTKPHIPYAISKWCAEQYVSSFSKGISLRFSNVYGPRQIPIGENQLIPRALTHVYDNTEFFEVNGDGEQTRDFIYVSDVARAVIDVATLENLHFGSSVYNVCSGKSQSVNYVLSKLLEYAESGIEFKRNCMHFDWKEPIHVEGSNLRIREQLNWYPRIKLDSGLKKTVAWWKKNMVE
jgi:UDP-glucose 4-epimerase